MVGVDVGDSAGEGGGADYEEPVEAVGEDEAGLGLSCRYCVHFCSVMMGRESERAKFRETWNWARDSIEG